MTTKKPVDMAAEVWNVADVAKFLHVGTKVVYRMVESGEIPAAKIGKRGKVRILRDDVLKLFPSRALRAV
jgi:excisionase family DNA binding protein